MDVLDLTACRSARSGSRVASILLRGRSPSRSLSSQLTNPGVLQSLTHCWPILINTGLGAIHVHVDHGLLTTARHDGSVRCSLGRFWSKGINYDPPNRSRQAFSVPRFVKLCLLCLEKMVCVTSYTHSVVILPAGVTLGHSVHLIRWTNSA